MANPPRSSAGLAITYPWLRLPELLLRERQGLGSIRQFQDRRLRRLVEYAWTHVSHYRRRFRDAGISPSEFRGLEDLRRLPLLEKASLRTARSREMLVPGVRTEDLIPHRTSGSSGHAVHIYRSWHEERILGLLRLRVLLHSATVLKFIPSRS